MSDMPFSISKGVAERAVIGCIYGQPGIGKTHLASQFSDSVLVADLEDGSSFLDVHRVSVKRFEKLVEIFKWLREKKEYKTLVIDSITALERIGIAYTCTTNKIENIEALPYGKGWSMYRAHMSYFLECLEYLRDQGFNIVLVGHSQVKAVNDPTQQNYDRMEYNIDGKLQPLVTSVLDFCFYMRPQVRTLEQKGGNKAFSDGTRELVTGDRGGALSKNRFSHLEEIIEFPNEKDREKLNQNYRQFWENVLKNNRA